MKIRDSGMPDREMWERFFSPDKILGTLGLDANVVNAVEFGCGYGTFTIPSARKITGKLFAFDIEPEINRFNNHFSCVLTRMIHHFRRHVYSDNKSFLTNSLRRKKSIKSSAAAKIKHRLAFF